MFDYPMHRFYKNAIFNSNDTFSVHLSGGFNDFLVPTYLAKGHGINVVVRLILYIGLACDCTQIFVLINPYKISIRERTISNYAIHTCN